MLRHYRRRQGYDEHSSVSWGRYVILGIICGVVVFTGGKRIASLLTERSSVQRVAAVLHAQERSSVYVSLDGGEAQRAENGLRLYPGDRLTTGDNAQTFVTFFDGTVLGLDEGTELMIEESIEGDLASTIDVSLSKGRLWIGTPVSTVYTGSIVRSVRTPSLVVNVPSGTEGLIDRRNLQFFSAEGLGGRIEVAGVSAIAYIGEGQQFFFPEIPIQDDLYRYRSPLAKTAYDDGLGIAGRSFLKSIRKESDTADPTDEESFPVTDMLTVTSPVEGVSVSEDTVAVQGTIGKQVRRIRINGYMVDIKPEESSFAYDLSLPHDAEVTIVVEALDDQGIPLVGLQRTIYRDIEAPVPPTIVFPSGSGTTYRTQRTELELRGSVHRDAIGITVNDYRLQLFVQGDPEWSYLASLLLGNLEYGRNVYEIRAIDTSGNVSAPVVITILMEDGEEGVVEKESDSTAFQEQGGAGDTPTLAKNPPTMPGSLKIIGPTEGEPFTATGSEFSIYGLAPQDAESIWINGYRLRLYKPGEPIWRYIASYTLGTMKRGKNIYTIVIRNRIGEVLDRLEYTVHYRVE